MQMNADLPLAGVLQSTLFGVFSLLQKIFSRKPAGRCGSYLGGVLHLSSGGFLVRDDRLPPTNSVPTVVVRQPEQTSL